jgi:hypothetical protein
MERLHNPSQRPRVHSGSGLRPSPRHVLAIVEVAIDDEGKQGQAFNAAKSRSITQVTQTLCIRIGELHYGDVATVRK